MTESITDILSGAGATASAPERIVDEPEAIIGADLATPEQTQLPESREEPQSDEDQQVGGKTVPLAALQKTREQGNKRYTEAVMDFDRRMADAERRQAERDAKFEARFVELAQQRQQQPEDPSGEFYSDPVGAARRIAREEAQAAQAGNQNLSTEVMKISAVLTHGAEKVAAFEQYVGEAIARNDPDMEFLAGQMRSSRDPMGTGLKWFEQRTFDPAAKEAEIEARVLAKYGIAPGEGQQQQAPQRQQIDPRSMPSTSITDSSSAAPRTGTGWAGPAPIGEILAAKQRSIFKR